MATEFSDRMTVFLKRFGVDHATTVLVTYGLVLVLLMFTSTGWIVSGSRLVTSDYLAIHAAGTLANDGHPAAVYDWPSMREAHTRTLGYDQDQFFAFPYPPPYIAVAGTLARLGYVGGALAFILSTFAAYVCVIRRTAGTRDATIYALASPTTMATGYVAQNGFLTSGLMGGALLALPTRPVLAGVLIGLLALKPQLGLLIPFALVAGGHWRSIGAAGATVLLASLAALLAWGTEPWLAFFAHMRTIFDYSGSNAELANKLQTLFGALVRLGVPVTQALAAQMALGAAAAIAVTLVWTSRAAFELKAASLACASLLASPYLFLYDLCLLVVALAFLMRHAARAPWSDGEIVTLVALNAPLLFIAALPVPPGVLSVLAMAMVIARRLAADPGFAGSRAQWSRSVAARLAPNDAAPAALKGQKS